MNQKQIEKKRCNEIDIMKGIGILLIILGHLEPETYLMRFIYSFHLFLFFAVSGFVDERYRDRSFKEIVCQNIRRLLIPYFIWNSISNLIEMSGGDINWHQFCMNIMYMNGSVGWNAALWFLVSLFWTDTVCAIVIRVKMVFQVCYMVLMLGLWICLASSKIMLPYGLYTVPIASFFWLMGYRINIDGVYEKIVNRRNGVNIWSACFGGYLLVVFGVFYNTVISIYHVNYSNYIFTIIAGIAGVYSLFCISIIIEKKFVALARLLRFYGENTLIILCTHYLILRSFGAVTQKYAGVNYWRLTSTPKSIIMTFVMGLIYYSIIAIKKTICNRIKICQ